MDAFEPQAAAFRFYEDGTQGGSSPIAAQDTDIIRVIMADSQLHLRYRVDEIGDGSIAGATTDDYTIEYRVNGGGGFTTVTASSARVQTDTASDLTDGANTTDRAIDGISAGPGSFFDGEQEEGDGEITDFQHEADNHTEHVWALDLINADWTDGDFVEFRMRINGSAMDNAVTPRITAAIFMPDADAFRLYEDGTESGSSPIAAENVNVTGRNLDSDSQVHLRWRVQETQGRPGASTDDWRMRYAINGGVLANVVDTDTFVRADNASGLTDDAATTNRSTDGITDGTGSFVAGEQEENSSPMEIVDHQLTADNFTEHVFALVLQSAGFSDGDFIEFHLRQVSTGDEINSIVPRITVTKAVGVVVRDPIQGPGVVPFAR